MNVVSDGRGKGERMKIKMNRQCCKAKPLHCNFFPQPSIVSLAGT